VPMFTLAAFSGLSVLMRKRLPTRESVIDAVLLKGGVGLAKLYPRAAPAVLPTVINDVQCWDRLTD